MKTKSDSNCRSYIFEAYFVSHVIAVNVPGYLLFGPILVAPCGLQGCKNGPAPFPCRMSYKATKPGLVCLSYISMFFIVLLFIMAPFYVLLVFIVCVLSFGCSS